MKGCPFNLQQCHSFTAGIMLTGWQTQPLTKVLSFFGIGLPYAHQKNKLLAKGSISHQVESVSITHGSMPVIFNMDAVGRCVLQASFAFCHGQRKSCGDAVGNRAPSLGQRCCAARVAMLVLFDQVRGVKGLPGLVLGIAQMLGALFASSQHRCEISVEHKHHLPARRLS